MKTSSIQHYFARKPNENNHHSPTIFTDMNIFFVYILPITIIALGIYLSFCTDILKDTTRDKNRQDKPYSLARTQLMWWTLIITSIFSAYFGKNNELMPFNDTCLILLGISLGTMTGAKVIDDIDLLNNKIRHQDTNHNKFFWCDILSDENGISVYRFQAVIFTFIFGVVFIYTFISNDKIVDFDAKIFALMGISSTTYLALKATENQTVITNDSTKNDIDGGPKAV